MKGAIKNDRLIRFSVFEVDRESGELFKQGRKMKLQGQPFELLLALLQRPGEVVTREELGQKVWPSDTAGDFDHGLNRAVNKVREALADSAEAPQFIETVPRKGYRFIGAIQEFQRRPVEPARSESRARIWTWISIAAASVLLVCIAWFLLHRAPAPAKVPTQEQLTFNSPENGVATAVISPDGKYLGYSDGEGIHVKLLSTSEERLIPRPPGISASASWDVASWSPEGTQILANVIDAGRQNSVWTVSLLGESARELRDEARGLAISSDGTQVAFAPRPVSSEAADIREIWLMGIQGDNPRKLLSLPEGEYIVRANWSSDGKRLAYLHGQFAGASWSIEASDLNGQRTTILPASSSGSMIFAG